MPQGGAILIVDDDQTTLDFLSEQLSQRGFSTQTALSSGQAIEKVRQNPFDLVLCDLKMPLVDGIDCMEILAQLAPSMRVIMISGEATVDSAVNAMKKGAYDFLLKPVQMERLLFLIDKALLNGRLDTLVDAYKKGMDILSTLSLEEIIDPMIRTVANFFRADRACWMEQTGDNALKFVASYGLLGTKERLAVLALAERALRRVGNEKENYRMMNDPERHATILPVFRDKRISGLLVLSRPDSGENFSLTDLRNAAQFAEQIHETVKSTELRRAFEDKISQLQKAYEALDASKNLLVQHEKMAQLGGMVVGVAHEIDDPLQCVVGYADLLLHQEDVNEGTKKSLSILLDEAKKCRGMVQSMLQYTRVNAPRFRWTHWRSIVSETLDLMAPDFRDQHVSVHVSVPANMPGLAADPDQLKQILINLLKNAVQAMAEQPEKRIDIEVAEDRETQKLQVADNGPGIPAEDLPKVFEPRLTVKESSRNGLGLSVCSEIVQRHHGKISAQSSPGKGACFMVELPRSQPDISEALEQAA